MAGYPRDAKELLAALLNFGEDSPPQVRVVSFELSFVVPVGDASREIDDRFAIGDYVRRFRGGMYHVASSALKTVCIPPITRAHSFQGCSSA